MLLHIPKSRIPCTLIGSPQDPPRIPTGSLLIIRLEPPRLTPSRPKATPPDTFSKPTLPIHITGLSYLCWVLLLSRLPAPSQCFRRPPSHSFNLRSRFGKPRQRPSTSKSRLLSSQDHCIRAPKSGALPDLQLLVRTLIPKHVPRQIQVPLLTV